MARERSDKSKNKSPKEEKKAGKSDEGMPTRPEPAELTRSGNPAQRNSLQSAAGSKKRQEKQQLEQERSTDLRESDKFSEHKTSDNGHQGIDNDSARRRISERAFILFQDRGCEHGNDWAHWFEAERQLKETQQDTQA